MPHVYLALGALLNPAHAQTQNDLEYREVLLEEEDRLETDVLFETQWHEFDNLDFRALDESSDQAILDSDDRQHIAFTGAALSLGYDVDEQLRFVLSASHRGLWGADQFGGTNVFGGWVYFSAAYADIETSKGENPVRFRVGRQFFKLGGLGSSPDFIIADVLDAIRVDIPLGDKGRLTLFPIDVTSVAGSTDGANFAAYNAQSNITTFGFNGDRMTRRHGAILDLDALGKFDVKAYAYYTDIGALGSGSDISYEGRLGNFSDNDWVANFGARAQGNFGPWRPFLSIDASTGIDRKELVARDVDANGFAGMAGVSLDARDEETGDGIGGDAYFFYALGPTFAEDGLMRSHGYVGMKAQQAGGLIANRYMGWHPTAYAALFGISDTAQEMDRKSGTQVAHVSLKFDAPGAFYANAGWWLMQDTGFTELDTSRLNTITPPFGYSREEFAAQARLSRVLGNEFNATVGAHATDKVDVYATAGMLLPGEYYSIEIARAAGDALGSPDPQMPWGVSGGTRVRF